MSWEDVTERDTKLYSHPEAKWFIIHTMAGQEEKVKEIIENKIENLGFKDRIFRLLIPYEKEVKVRGGKTKEIKRRLYPGYIFVEMILDNDTWKLIRGVQGVTGFVGPQGKPQPLSDDEVERTIKPFIEGKIPVKRVEFAPGDRVRVVAGPFKDSHAIVESVVPEKGKLVVSIIVFGRETPVELDMSEVEKIEG